MRAEPLDATASNASASSPRETRKRAREAIFARFDASATARGAKLAKRRGKGNCVELELEALGGVSDETLAKFATYGDKVQKMMQKATPRGATPGLAPIRYAARGTLFNEPYRVSVDEQGVHRVVWGKEGESRRVVRSKDGARTPQEAVECVHVEILRRMNENIASVSDESHDGTFEARICRNCLCDCSKTPLMRRGPDGIGTLCNACGLWWSRHQTMREYPSVVPEETPHKAIFIRNPVKSRRALKTLDVFGYYSSSVQATLAKACAAVLQEERRSLRLPRVKSKPDVRYDFKRAIHDVFDRCDCVFADSPSHSDDLGWEHYPPSITDFAAEQLEELEGVKLEGVKLEGVKLEGVELEGVELEELELEELEAFAFGFEPPRLDPV
jgi:hypothetical protein